MHYKSIFQVPGAWSLSESLKKIWIKFGYLSDIESDSFDTEVSENDMCEADVTEPMIDNDHEGNGIVGTIDY